MNMMIRMILYGNIRNIINVLKYRERDNRPSWVVNRMSLVHNYDKAGNKCYSQDNTDTRET